VRDILEAAPGHPGCCDRAELRMLLGVVPKASLKERLK
jgi:hypothetical protein